MGRCFKVTPSLAYSSVSSGEGAVTFLSPPRGMGVLSCPECQLPALRQQPGSVLGALWVLLTVAAAPLKPPGVDWKKSP